MAKCTFVNGQIYHVYNRGNDKRNIFTDQYDLQRFFESMQMFNSVEPIGSIYEASFQKDKVELGRPTSKLVEFLCYCLNPNHFHFMIRQEVDGGISEFMKRLGGYTKYFNERYKRSGVLFQGKFKAKHILDNTYLLHLSAYINLNNNFGAEQHLLSKSSWKEYCLEERNGICSKDLIIGQYKDPDGYKKFALSSLEDIKLRKARGLEM